MLTMRQKNPRYFKEWAVINAGATYSRSILGTNKLSTYFGMSTSKTAMYNVIFPRGHYDTVFAKSKSNLKNEEDGMGMFDNTQQVMLLKHPRDATSAKMVSQTLQMFARLYKHESLELIDNTNSHRVTITYVDQQICAPYGFPDFIDTDIMKNLDNLPVGLTDNNTHENQVALNMEMLNQIHSMNQLQYWIKCTDKNILLLKLNKAVRIGLNESGISKRLYNFQRNVTILWCGIRPPIQGMILPVSIEDKLTQKGALNVVLGMIHQFGLFDVNTKKYKESGFLIVSLPNGYNKKLLLMVGDGLTQARSTRLKQLVGEGCSNYQEQRSNLHVIKKALNRVINCPGDLHGQFHVMASIYHFLWFIPSTLTGRIGLETNYW